ncbi:MAG: hypothetical protein ACI8S6_002385 [Myxococcota bacterium]|jgi:hypothetical protein
MIWALLLGCLPELVYYEVAVSGTFSAADGAGGPVHGQVLLAQAGEGALSFPMEPVVDFELEGPGEYSLIVEVPDEGTGLAVYGWQDRDGDGLLCEVGQDAEPTGAAITDDFPASEATLSVVLDAPCLGPEAYGEAEVVP